MGGGGMGGGGGGGIGGGGMGGGGMGGMGGGGSMGGGGGGGMDWGGLSKLVNGMQGAQQNTGGNASYDDFANQCAEAPKHPQQPCSTSCQHVPLGANRQPYALYVIWRPTAALPD